MFYCRGYRINSLLNMRIEFLSATMKFVKNCEHHQCLADDSQS